MAKCLIGNSVFLIPVLTIAWTSDVSISIYDILGKELISRKTAKQIDINFLKKGIYFINISDGIKTSVRKFIKN